ncbi:DUF2953 domain-containing protein [Metabacillus sp. 84]|uniref:DUF2953 domain-containing protein n=1 Tax=unclassified Metabacillus TaxID=2675274 RepID=UPI003CF18FCC
MSWLYGMLMLLSAIFVLLLFTRLSITFEYRRIARNDELKISFRAWFGVLRYTYKIPVIKFNVSDLSVDAVKEKSTGKDENSGKAKEEKITENDVKAGLKDFKELTEHIIGLHSIITKFLKHIEITTLEWHSRFGTGDAASTGSAAGMVWTLKGLVCGAAENFMKLNTSPVLSVVPVFQGLCLDTMVVCMFRFRLGHAIIGGLRFVKYWKGGKTHFTNKPLSKLFGQQNKSA